MPSLSYVRDYNLRYFIRHGYVTGHDVCTCCIIVSDIHDIVHIIRGP